MSKALEGIRVLDFTQYEAGPSSTQMLAWLGADVIKIEAPGGEQGRTALSDKRGEDSWFFLLLNSNKRSITLNLKTDRGREMFRELATTADVVVENLGPGAMGRLGLGWDVLSKLNPRLIMASVKGFGSTGPYADYKSFEWIAQAMAGAMSMTGHPDGPPTKAIGGLADTGAGLHTAIGVLAAIVQRQTTGLGQLVEVAQQDAVVNLILGQGGVPCGAVLDSNEVLANEHMRGRGFITELEHPRRGKYPMPGNPVRMSDSPTHVERAPLLGEHNAEVFGKVLGLSDVEIEKLKTDGVI